MTQSKNASLIQLIEVFPTWSQEDLLTVLNEAGGDVYVAISRISEGHVSKWSDSSKKTATLASFESRPTRTERNTDRSRESRDNNFSLNNRTTERTQRPMVREQRDQRERPQPTVNRKVAATSTKTSTSVPSKPAAVKAPESYEDLSWGDSTEDVSVVSASIVSTASITEPKTSFAEAAASALSGKPKIEKKEVPVAAEKKADAVVNTEPEVIATEPEITEATPVESVQTAVVPEIVIAEIEIAVYEEIKPASEVVFGSAQEFEDEEIVSMPTRATPSLTMEQPAVVLPVRTNLRANLSVRFGYDVSVEETEKTLSVEESIIQAVKTPITVSALESTFAMLSTSPAPVVKSPEPILSPPSPESSAWENSRNSTGAPSSGYGNFSRNRQHGGWDYEPTSSASTVAPTASQGASFGPAPGFGGPTSPSTAGPQRFVSRAAAQYEHPSVYNPSAVPSNAGSNSRYSPYEDSNTASNNVSQYYTTTRTAAPQNTSGYPVYRGNNSFNASRYNTSNNRPYYQQHPHHQAAPVAQQQPAAAGHYSPYNPHQNYLNNYHHGYPQYHQHADQYANQQQQQPQQPQPQQLQQQPYYQPYQPPNQYLSYSNMHPHNHHHQNQHPNA